MELPRGYISYNQIRLYHLCPRKYFYVYVQGMASAINDKVYLGIVFHAAVEAHLKKRIDGQFHTTAESLDVFRQIFKAEDENHQVLWQSSKHDTQQRGLALMRHYLKELDKTIDPLMVELEVEATLPTINVQLRGIIDLVEKDFGISDFKTSTNRWLKERAQKSFLQMVIYKFLFEEKFGPASGALKFLILYARSSATVRHQVIRFLPAEANYNEMIKVISFVVDSIRNEAFYANPSYHCGFCEFKDHCRTQVSA